MVKIIETGFCKTKYKDIFVGFEVLTTAVMKSPLVWGITPRTS
jgi:hypothetical protein